MQLEAVIIHVVGMRNKKQKKAQMRQQGVKAILMMQFACG